MSSGPISESARGAGPVRLSLVASVCLASVVSTHAQETPSETPPVSIAEQKAVFKAIGDEVADLFAKHKDAVVRIEATDPFGRRGGTGFFIDPSGTIYTNFSVAGRSWNLTVEYAQKKYPARCLLSDPHSGVMILKIDSAAQTPFLSVGRSEDLKIASPVVAIGYPLDSPVSPTFGLVAGFDLKCPGGYLPTTHIRANMPVRAGEAGAPVLNERGEVVGILAYQLDFGAVCLVLPIQAAEKVRGDYVRFGRACPGWIGMNAGPSDGDDEQDAVKVLNVADDAPAAKSGLREGDIITRFGRTAIHHFADLRNASFFLTADDTVPVTVLRGDQELTFEIHAANAPGGQDRATPENNGIESGPRVALPTAPVGAGQGRPW